jgi:hypothetical protein
VDELLGGGFPRGAVSEISGNQSSNRTALTVSILVHACDAGECCAWIDAGGAFDPESAAEAGLRLEQLLWVNCQGQAEAALKAADLLLHGGGFWLIRCCRSSRSPDLDDLLVPSPARCRGNGHSSDYPHTYSADPLLFRSMCRTQAHEIAVAWKAVAGLASLLATRKHIGLKSASFESVL